MINNEGIIGELEIYKENGNKTVSQYIEEIKQSGKKNIFIGISNTEEENQRKKIKRKIKTNNKSKGVESGQKKYENLESLNKVKKYFEYSIRGALIVTNKKGKFYDISIKSKAN